MPSACHVKQAVSGGGDVVVAGIDDDVELPPMLVVDVVEEPVEVVDVVGPLEVVVELPPTVVVDAGIEDVPDPVVVLAVEVAGMFPPPWGADVVEDAAPSWPTRTPTPAAAPAAAPTATPIPIPPVDAATPVAVRNPVIPVA